MIKMFIIDTYNSFMRWVGPWGVMILKFFGGIFLLWLSMNIFTPNSIIGVIALIFLLWGLYITFDAFFMIIFGTQGLIIPVIGTSIQYYELICPHCGKKLNRYNLGRITCGFCYQYFDTNK